MQKQTKPSRSQLIFLVIAIFAILISVSSASASPLPSSSQVYVSTNGSDANNGSTEAPYLTIAKGVESVSENGTVHIANGVYSGTNNTNITISKSMNITGQSQTGTIINGTGTNWIFNIQNGVTVTIQNLTITNATAYYGAAIYNDEGNMTIKGCTFSNNSADGDGGVIYTYGGNTLIIGSTFTGNSADGDGGVIYTSSSYSVYGDNFSIINCTFIGNSADGEAGVIYNEQNLNLTNCSFTGNTGYDGGAIYNCCGDETITGCTFVNNTATNDGGAIYNYMYLTANFNRIVGNTALEGSALYNDQGYTANVEYNWWGSNTNPKLVSNLIAGDVEDVDADPWLILSINATPSEIFNTKTSNVTVDLYTDSNNNSHSSESAKYPAVIPVTFSTTWGSVTQSVLNYGTGVATFTADGGTIPTPNVATVSAADSANLTATVSTNITIKPASNLYVKITSSNSKPTIGETFTLTYKLGNKGPDAATNVTITMPVPENFEISSITGDGNWTYNAATRTITWTLANVTVGDPYLYVTGKTTKAGVYSFGSSIASDTYNLNTEDVTPLTINAADPTEVNAASGTVAMQKTGAPLNCLILAILAVISGFAMPRRK